MIKSHSFQKEYKGYHTIETIDLHTAGEPLRVVVSGYPEIQGDNVLMRRKFCREHLDEYRRILIHEPRGHADMYGCVIVPPNDDGADIGVIFMHNDGYSTMCGHAIIALAKLIVKMDWKTVVEGPNTMCIDAPCGRIESSVVIKNSKASQISFKGVPSFVVGLDYKMMIEGLGNVKFDIAYGGAYYAYVDMSENHFDFDLDKENYEAIKATGMIIKEAIINSNIEIIHPFEQDLNFLYGTIFIDNSRSRSENDSRNVCVFADGEIDRSPTGSGVCGRMAIHYAKGEVEMNETMNIESIIGTVFNASIIEIEEYGGYEAVIPLVSGHAYITGFHNFVIDPEDTLKHGFSLK